MIVELGESQHLSSENNDIYFKTVLNKTTHACCKRRAGANPIKNELLRVCKIVPKRHIMGLATLLEPVFRANRLLLVKCYDNKLV